MLSRSLLVAVVVLSLAAASSATARTEITWWHALGGQLGEALDGVAAGFNASQDEYEIVPVFLGTYAEAMTTAIAAFRANEQPHILQVFEVGTATMMAAEGAIYPVHQRMADFGSALDQSDFLPAMISYYVSDAGDLLSMPFNTSTPVPWYNKTALDQIGVEVPTTWDDLEAVGRAARASGFPCGFSFGWDPWVLLENYSALHDLPFATLNNGYGGLGTELVFNNDHTVRLFERLAHLADEGVLVYGGRRGDSLPLFMNGECPLWMNSSAYYGGISANAPLEFGQAMLPLDTDARSEIQNGIIGGATLWVPQGHRSAEYEGVARFFEYLQSTGVQADWHQSTGYVPITTAAYDVSLADGFYERFLGTDVSVRQLSLNEPTASSRGLRLGNFVQIRDVLDETIEAVIAGQMPARQALDEAARRGNDLLRQFEAANR